MKILSNYFQILSTCLSFSFKWPEFLQRIFTPINFIGQGSSEMVVSFDCMLQETRLIFFGHSDFIYKTFLSICFCIFLVFFYLFIGFLVKILFWKRVILKRLIFVSFVTILFIQYSSFSNSLLNFFNCWEINDEVLLLRDMQTKCWESKHLIWALVFGLPGLILVLLVIPFAGILFLVLKRNSAEKP